MEADSKRQTRMELISKPADVDKKLDDEKKAWDLNCERNKPIYYERRKAPHTDKSLKRRMTPKNSSPGRPLKEEMKDILEEWSDWKPVCYPLSPEKFLQTPKQTSYSLLRRLKPFLERGIRKYPDDVEELLSGGSQSLDLLVSLLSSSGGKFLVRKGGDRVVLNTATFRNKYVLVCCFNAPVLWETRCFQHLINLCEELYITRQDFEMVMVARMNSVADNQTIFNHFFSAFPDSCLAVPYGDSKRRDHICRLLGLNQYLDSIKCRFFDACGKSVPSFDENILFDYGAEAFPFTMEARNPIEAGLESLRRNELSQLLKPPNGSLEAAISNQIAGKHVGLYMCLEGELIPHLHKLHDLCRKDSLDFEIVVLYCPRGDKLDPKIHKEKIDSLLGKHGVRDWLRLPYNNSVTMRFDFLTGCYYANGYPPPPDKLIIVGPDGKILDMYGAEVVIKHNCGIDAYPFTRYAHVAALVNKLEKITLKELFIERSVYRGIDKTKTTSVDKLLQGKEIIVCLDSVHGIRHTSIFDKIVSAYDEMKGRYGDEFEMVFFHNQCGDYTTEELEGVQSRMPWYVHPDNGTCSRELNELINLCYCEGFFGFGVDGKLCSVRYLYNDYGEAGLCLDPTLEEDVNRLYGYSYYREI